MPRRSRQNIDRRKGGNFAHINFWVPIELQRAAKKAAKARGVTLTDLIASALATHLGPAQ